MSINAFNSTLLASQRVAKGWTRGELAEMAWVTAQDIFHWETGRGTPYLRQSMRLASALGVPLTDLYFGVDPTVIPV